jgi:hypothetical protein
MLLVAIVAGLGVILVFSSQESSGATLLAGVLVAVGAYRTVQVTREGQITDRITDAVKLLATRRSKDTTTDDVQDTPDEVAVLGGIYALERIARDSRVDYGPIMEILTAYVRQRASRQNRGPDEVPNDVQAVLAVLGRRAPHRGELRLDLRFTDLRKAKLPRAQLGNAILWDADLRGAHLEGADLVGAKLGGAKLQGADLYGADLYGADLQGAHLQGAHLQGADLYGADLQGAQLQGAHLQGADLHGALGLREADLTGAEYDKDTSWPDGFHPQPHGRKRVAEPG